ncbi:MAG: DUF1499 domain-containing protein [Vicinamibacterales bacterium]
MLLTRLGPAVALLGLLVVALPGPAYRLGLIALPTAVPLVRYGAFIGAAGLALSVAALLLAMRRSARQRPGPALAGVLLGLVAFGLPFRLAQTASAVPPIHDITTDTTDPPVFSAIVPLRADVPNSLEYTPEVARLTQEAYPDLRTLTLPLPAAEAFDRALEAARAQGWDIVAASPDEGRIEASDTTTWFGFVDDVVIRLTPEGTATRLDIRSVSRVGRSDLGTNARRIRDYLASLR